MVKKEINVFAGDTGKSKIELETKSLLSDIRKELLDKITFPFIFLDEDEKEIPKESENTMKLEDILVGKNLFLKQEKIKRIMLGRKVESINGLDFYVYPQLKLTNEQKECSSNIMVIGETGVGKSTWIHSFINYLQSIQLEENNRYYLFDEKSLQEEYQKKHGKKPEGCSVTDEPAIYNIEATKLFNNPIRLIDTAGFGDTRGPKYDEKITVDIQNLFEGSEIETLNAVCLIFKATNTRSTDRLKMVMNKLFSLFGKEIKNNIVIIFTFCDSFKDIKGVEVLKDKGGPFYEVLGDIEKIPYFGFNNLAYFTSDKEMFEKAYQNNTKNFGRLLKHIFSLKRISLESTKKVIQHRMHIKNNIANLCTKLNNIMLVIDAATQNQIRLYDLTKELEQNSASEVGQIPYTIQEPYEEIIDKEMKCDSGWYVLYCNTCEKVCHAKCKGSNEGWHSTEYGCNIITTWGHECTECGCKDVNHKFKDSYIAKEKVTKYKDVVKWKDDPDAKQSEEQKRKNRDIINKQMEEENRQMLERNKEIHYSLREGIDCLYQLALKNNELNLLALKKDKEKYGFTKEILSENLKDKAKSPLFDLFNQSLNNIEKLCESNESKEETINQFESKLLPKKEN